MPSPAPIPREEAEEEEQQGDSDREGHGVHQGHPWPGKHEEYSDSEHKPERRTQSDDIKGLASELRVLHCLDPLCRPPGYARAPIQASPDITALAASIVDEATSDEPRDPYEGDRSAKSAA